MKRLLLAFVLLPVAALGQAINAPPTISSFNQLQGSTGTAITGFGMSIGQALGPLVNYQGSGLPGLLVNGRLIFGRTVTAPTDFTTVQINRDATFAGGTQTNSALNVATTQGAAAGTNEWSILSTCKTSSTVGGSNCLGAYLQGTRNAGGKGVVWGAVSQAIDLSDASSASSGANPTVGLEVDVNANDADDHTNAAAVGGKGNRVGIDIVGMRQVGTDTDQTQFAYGLWLTTATLPLVAGMDAHTNFMSAVGVGKNLQAYSVFDSRGAIPPTASVNPVYGLNMDAGQAIEFNGDDSTLSPAPQRTLLYTGSALSYQVSGVTQWSVSDTGVVNAAGGFSVGGQAVGSVYYGATNTSAGNTSYNARVGNGLTFNVYNTAYGYGALDADINAAEMTGFGYLTLNKVTSGTGETAVGYNVLPRDTQGSFNTGLGSDVLRYYNGTAAGNVAVGHGAIAGDDTAPLDMTGGTNTAVGTWSGQELTTGSNNTLIGAKAGVEVQTGTENVAVGVFANAGCNGCANNIPQANAASFNTAIGTWALEQNAANGNTAVGYKALTANITGIQNTSMGFQSLAAATGNSNTAVGYNSMTVNVTSASNTAVGALTLLNLTGGTGNNTAIGASAAKQLTTGANNTVVGASAMFGDPVSPVSNTSSGNVAVGLWSGAEISTGNNNTFVGYLSGVEVQTGSTNTALGTWALAGCNACTTPTIGSVTTASNNTAVGHQALMNDTGNNNTAVGFQALTANTTGVQGTAVGTQALTAATGGQNTAFGFSAGKTITSGTANLVLGANVGSTTLATGSRNILIGTASNCDAAAAGTVDSFTICASTGSTHVITGSLATAGGTMRLNGTGGDTFIGSATALIATSLVGYFHFPAQSAAPTATPTNTGVACAYNTATNVINCYNGSGWFKFAGVAGAG
jgi:hypothetical protein